MSNLPAIVTFRPIGDVPDKAPAPKFDLDNPELSASDIFQDNYFSLESLQLWLEEREADWRMLTVTGCTVEYVFDPEKGEETGEWKPCLSFQETETMLVINRSRRDMLRKMTGSARLADWGNAGQVVIKPGIFNSKAQILIAPLPKANGKASRKPSVEDYTPAQANDDLFAN